VLNRSHQFEVFQSAIETSGEKAASYPVTAIRTGVQYLRWDGDNLKVEEGCLTLIPYYAWAHRGSGKMMVWLPTEAIIQ